MAQKEEKSNADLTPRFEHRGAMRIAGLSGRFGPENRDRLPALWMRWGPQYFGRTPGQVGKKCYGVCWNMDDRGRLDYLAGVEVASFAGLPSELTQMTIEPQRYAVFAHSGHISAIGATWMEIFGKWAPKSRYELAAAPSFELYDEEFDPAVGMGHVEIWIPVRT